MKQVHKLLDAFGLMFTECFKFFVIVGIGRGDKVKVKSGLCEQFKLSISVKHRTFGILGNSFCFSHHCFIFFR